MAYHYYCQSCTLQGYCKDERGLQRLVNHKLENPKHELVLQIVAEQPSGLRGFLNWIT